MSYSNFLLNRLRRVAREVFPRDSNRSVNLTNMSKYTRMYLHRIVQRAENPPFNLIVTDLQLARSFRLPLSKFLQWFHHDVKLVKVFRRVRWFLREMIILNILEDHGQLGESEVNVPLFNRPNRRTMAVFRQLTEMIRAESQNRKPEIEDLTDAEEMIGWIQDGYSSTSSSEDDNESVAVGEYPEEVDEVGDDTGESTNTLGLIGKSQNFYL